MRACLLALAACNQSFGLEATALVDAPGPDAPARCTVDEPPPFSTRFIQAIIQKCTHYTFQQTQAIALCRDAFYGVPYISEGMLDAPLERTSIELGARVPVGVQLSPDGELYVQHRDPEVVAGPAVVSVYVREVEWTWSHDLTLSLAVADRFGVPSRGPRRQLLVQRGTSKLEEYVDDTDTWSLVRTYTAASLGITVFDGAANLSSDGLRMTVPADDTVFYATRSTSDAAFTRVARMELPNVAHAFLAEDCSRIYFDGLGSIFYATHR